MFIRGDRVVATGNWDGNNTEGKIGTIIKCSGDHSNAYCTIRFDELLNKKHNGGRNNDDIEFGVGQCWDVDAKLIKLTTQMSEY